MGLGMSRLRQGDGATALQHFQSAVKANPKLPKAYMGVGQSYMQMGPDHQQDAVQNLRKALQLNPQLASARLLLSRLFTKQDKTEEALSEIRSLLTFQPDSVAGHMTAGQIYVTKKQYDLARRSFETALNLNPSLPRTSLLGYVEALTAENRLSEARDILKDVPMSNSIAPKLHKLWGDLYYRQGLTQQAAEEYRAAALLASEDGGATAEDDPFMDDQEENWESMIESYREAAAANVAAMGGRRRRGQG